MHFFLIATLLLWLLAMLDFIHILSLYFLCTHHMHDDGGLLSTAVMNEDEVKVFRCSSAVQPLANLLW